MNPFELTCSEAAVEMARRYGKGAFHASALYREVFKHGNTSPAGVKEFAQSPALAAKLVQDLLLPSCRIERQEGEETLKFASRLHDGGVIESVVIPSGGRTTLCVSSQVGCRMGCRFCTTGGMGFVRSLSTAEIVWQAYAARFLLGRRVDNVVFMGMGEPFDNLDAVIQAVRVLNDQRGLDIPLGRITLSTAGHVDGIERLAALDLPKLRLAVSLNAADNSLRDTLMPINRRYPLERLKEALLRFPLARDGVVFVEYVLLAGVNDSLDDAGRLVRFLEGLRARVNVLAYNSGSAQRYAAPSAEQVRRFCGWLAEKKVFVRARQSKGREIAAACGQLGAALSQPK
ncbi:MAG: 23S rRNA (adenine(2503)-C(2))-methyltransferase RlmN [Desulfobacteraceae bacterium]|nr:23S rRNA (adenine(2503)-C(2))-methyltransferase RlmN [Desulfobacteraceae bacterium]